MPPITRSQTSSSSLSSSSPVGHSQLNHGRSSGRSRSRSKSSNGSINDADIDHTLVPHATQLNLPLVLPPPVGRQLLSLCFHSSWQPRGNLRFHFVSTDVLLDDAPDSSSPNLSDLESDPGHDPEYHHDFLTVVTYDPIAVPSSPSTAPPCALPAASLFPLLLIFVTLFLAIDSFASIRPYTCPVLRTRHRCSLPFSTTSSASNHYTVTTATTKTATAAAAEETSSRTIITLRNLTAIVRPYAHLVRLLDHQNTVLPAIQREFSELCLTAWALPHIDSEPCYWIVDLLDQANVHLSQLLVGIHTRGPGNPVSALNDTIVLMAYGVYQRRQQHQHQGHSSSDPDDDANGGGGVWNRTAEGVFHAITSQVPNWWDDHNALAMPLQSVLSSLREARDLEDRVSAVFKSAISDVDPKSFPAEDVLYALDRLFDPLLARRDTLLHTLESAVRRLDEAAHQMYTFNSTLYELRGEALAGKRPRRFEDFDALLSRLADAVQVLSHEMEAVGVRERRDTRRLEDERTAREAVEASRPRHRRARERASAREERAQSQWLWW